MQQFLASNFSPSDKTEILYFNENSFNIFCTKNVEENTGNLEHEDYCFPDCQYYLEKSTVIIYHVRKRQ